MGVLQNVIRTAVISALGAKMARGRSPIVAALLALLVSRALAKNSDEKKPEIPGTEEGLGGLVEQFRKGGLEEVTKSWIGTGANKPVSPNQLRRSARRLSMGFREKRVCRAMTSSRSSRAYSPR